MCWALPIYKFSPSDVFPPITALGGTCPPCAGSQSKLCSHKTCQNDIYSMSFTRYMNLLGTVPLQPLCHRKECKQCVWRELLWRESNRLRRKPYLRRWGRHLCRYRLGELWMVRHHVWPWCQPNSKLVSKSICQFDVRHMGN